MPRSLPINNGQIFVVPTSSVFGQEKPVRRREKDEEVPLNLSIKNNVETSARKRENFHPTDHEYSRQQYTEEMIEIKQEDDQNNILIHQETAEVPSQEFGNLLIVSNIHSDVVQEEIVETHEYVTAEEERVEFVFDTEADAACGIRIDDKKGNYANFNDATDKIEAEETKYVNDLMLEESRNTILKTKYNNLLEQVERLREYLDNEAKKERSGRMQSSDNTPQVKIVQTSQITIPYSDSGMEFSNMTKNLSSSSSEFDIKSEGDETESAQPATKRSRYNSWPQMSTLSSSQRKKEQNKLASKRFRERKKQEMERAKTEIMELEVRNDLLRKQETCILSEIDNVKKFLLDVNLIKVVHLPSGHTKIQLNN